MQGTAKRPPGPTTWWSGFRNTISSLSGLERERMKRLQRQYGEVFYYNSYFGPTILVTDLDLQRKLVGMEREGRCVERQVLPAAKSSIGTKSKMVHRDTAREIGTFLNESFAEPFKDELLAKIWKAAGKITQGWHQGSKPQTVDFYSLLQDAVAELTLSFLLGGTDMPIGHQQKMIEDLKAVSMSYRRRAQLARHLRRTDAARSDLEEAISSELNSRQITSSGKKGDFLDILIQQLDDAQRLYSEELLVDSIVSCFMMSYESLPGLISNLLWHLAQNPPFTRTLMMELEAEGVVADTNTNYRFLREPLLLPMLEAAILECFRLSPPTTVVVYKAKEDFVFGEYLIHKDERITLNLSISMSSDDHFGSDARRWVPLRWVVTEKASHETQRPPSSDDALKYLLDKSNHSLLYLSGWEELLRIQVRALLLSILLRYRYELVDAKKSNEGGVWLPNTTSLPARLFLRPTKKEESGGIEDVRQKVADLHKFC